MSRSIRTFIAVDVPCTAGLRKFLNRLADSGPGLRTVKADGLHVTLAFWGDTPPEKIPKICAAMESVAALHNDFELTLQGVGAFPNSHNSRVVWAGLQPAEPLDALAEMLGNKLEAVDWPREARAFQPHCTIARCKGPASERLRSLLCESANASFGTFTVAEITLYQSELNRDGPCYSVLSRHEFAPLP